MRTYSESIPEHLLSAAVAEVLPMRSIQGNETRILVRFACEPSENWYLAGKFYGYGIAVNHCDLINLSIRQIRNLCAKLNDSSAEISSVRSSWEIS